MIVKNVRLKYGAIATPNDEGKYKAIFVFDDEEQEEALKETIMNFWEDNKKKGSKKKPDNVPFLISEPSEEYPDPEDEGKLIFIATKNEATKDGKSMYVPVFKKNGIEYDKDEIPNVGAGTIANISIDLFTWEFKGKHGVSIWLQKIQILDLHEYAGGDSFGNESDEKFDEEPKKSKKGKKGKKSKKA